MFFRSTLKGIARLVLATLLFAQSALALAGCDWVRAAPALAISASSSQMPCHEEPAVNANLCLAHCLSADQSAVTHHVVVPVWVNCAPIAFVVSERWIARMVDVQFELPWHSAPPPRILFQTFLI